jgi:acyl carrier protein
MSQFKQALKAHLSHELGLSPAEIADDTELFSSGLLDSLRVIDLIEFVERLSGARLPAAALRLEHFDSVERIERFVASLAGDRRAS